MKNPLMGVMALLLGWSLAVIPVTAEEETPPPAGDKAAVLNGTVITAVEGTPIEGAKVRIGSIRTQTNAQGEYSLSLGSEGPFVVRVTHENFRSVAETVKLSFEEATTLQFKLQADDDQDGDGDEDVDEDDNDGDEEDQDVEVKGIVFDAATKSLITGATVKLGDNTETVEDDGRFEFEDLAPGTYPLSVSADGYTTVEQSLTLVADEDQFLSIGLSKVGDTTTPPPAPEFGKVEGTVIDKLTGKPLANVWVRAGSGVDQTDEAGKYLIEGVPAGDVTIMAKAEGYVTEIQKITLAKDATATVDFSLENRPQPTNGLGSIHGVVLSEEDGKPVANAKVQLGEDVTVSTNENGEFTLTDVRAGRREIRVSAEGFETEVEDVRVHPGQVAEVTLKLEADEEDEAPVPVKTGALSGVVTSCPDTAFGEDGTVNLELCNVPVAGAVVRVGKLRAATGDDGSFTLSGVPVGTVEVEIHKVGFGSVEQEVEVTEGINTLNVVLLPKEHKNDGDDEEDPKPAPGAGTGVISGIVSDESGAIVSGAVVIIRGKRGFTERAVADGTGRYEFKNLVNGRYTLDVWADGFRHTHKRAEITEGQALTVDVTLHTRKAKGDLDKGGDDKIGDTDEDGDISIVDVLETLRAALGIDDLTLDSLKKARMDLAPGKPNGDYGDGEVDLRDAIKLLRALVKLELVL